MKPRSVFFLISFIVLISLWLNLPSQWPSFKQIPEKITIFSKEIPLRPHHPQINLALGRFSFIRDLEIKKGLDLQGGVEVVLKADVAKLDPGLKEQALESARTVIARRVDLYGVTESVVKTSIVGDSYRLTVQMPGLDNPDKALELIGKTAQLVFASPKYSQSPAAATISAQPQLTGFLPTDLTGADLKKAELTYQTKDSSPAVSIEFTKEGKDKFARLTKTYLNKPIAIILDGQMISAPIVQSEITTGQAIISGNFTTDQARSLTTQLNAGALPVPISIISQKNIPATLGEQSIRQSLSAGGIGLFLVVFFMVAYYGQLGAIASIGLGIYALITLALYRLIPITLTLPGIAGFILSVGMAVDSNILIFERFKEELHAGKSHALALELGFGRAWDSIRDANIATIMTAFVLFNPLDWPFLNSAGSVRGFALTLMLGIFISLFTGIIVTRTLLRLFLKPSKKIINQP